MACYRSLDFLGYPNYRVGDDGSVWSYRSFDQKGYGRRWRWRILRQSPANKYRMVRLCHKGMIKSFTVHSLVLFAFVGPRPKNHEARHYPNQDPEDNRLCNLSWSSKKVNQRDRIENGTDNRGEKHGNSVLTGTKVQKIRKFRKTNPQKWTLKKLAERFGVSIPTIYEIVIYKGWKHIP